jgi:NADP-dependent 3-hydroxy acid dehydrogenase YdfG
MMAMEGAKVVCAGRNKERMEQVVNRIKEAGGEASVLSWTCPSSQCNKTVALQLKSIEKLISSAIRRDFSTDLKIQ